METYIKRIYKKPYIETGNTWRGNLNVKKACVKRDMYRKEIYTKRQLIQKRDKYKNIYGEETLIKMYIKKEIRFTNE